MSSFTSSPQRSKSTSAEHNVEVHEGNVPSRIADSSAVSSASHISSSPNVATVRKKRTITTSRRKREEQKLKEQALAEEPPDDYTRTTVEKMRSLMQSTQPKLPITKVIELVGIPTNKFYELRKRYLPGVYRTASSKKHRMNSEEEQVAVKKIRALIQESPHATMQEIIRRVGLPTTKFYDLRRRFLSHMFDGSSSKRKTPTSTAVSTNNKREQKIKPPSSSVKPENDENDEEIDESGSDESSEPSELGARAAVVPTLPSTIAISTANNNNFNYAPTNVAADTIAAAGLIMSHLHQQQQYPTSSTASFISCLQPPPLPQATSNAAVAANFVTNFTGGDMQGRLKVEPFVGTLTLPTNMQMPTSMPVTIPFMNADQFGNLTAMNAMPTSTDFGQQQFQHQQQQQLQQQQINMNPYWAYTTTTMLPDK